MNVSGNIVKNFSIDEMSNSKALEDIKLVLSPELIEHAQMMQELRDTYGKPLKVNSWYRTKTFNTSVGGNTNSEHLIGCATDIGNIPAAMFPQFMEWWKAICASHNKVGNVGYYSWGMHFGSQAGRVGYKKFNVFDKR